MKYPKRKDKYDCDLLCENFHEVEHRLMALEEGGGGHGDVPAEAVLVSVPITGWGSNKITIPVAGVKAEADVVFYLVSAGEVMIN